jgi:hypothetical protein
MGGREVRKELRRWGYSVGERFKPAALERARIINNDYRRGIWV